MSDITIIGFPQSSWTWATKLFAHERGVDVALDPQPPHSPPVTAISPVGKIPVMRHGDKTLAESVAICAYLDAQGQGDSLMPVSDADRQWVSILQTTVDQVLIRQYLFAYLFPKTDDGQPDRDLIEGMIDDVERQFDVLLRALDEGAIGGGTWNVVDAFAIPILFYASQFPEGKAALGARPALKSYLDQMMARPSFAATAPPPAS